LKIIKGSYKKGYTKSKKSLIIKGEGSSKNTSFGSRWFRNSQLFKILITFFFIEIQGGRLVFQATKKNNIGGQLPKDFHLLSLNDASNTQTYIQNLYFYY
jgi:hypothetical protein